MQESGIHRQARKKAPIWSIGIFSGPSLADLRPANETVMPVLSAEDVTDIPAQFVADPFMLNAGNVWHMFFEVMNAQTGKGDIGFARSTNGLRWDYQQIVLSEPFHLSYPHVFFAQNEYFMIPESHEANLIRLYRALTFPNKWKPVQTILEGRWADSSIFFFDGMWWLFSNPATPPHQVLELFYARNIADLWHRHPMSPVVTANNRMARCAGRVIVADNRLIRFTQDCYPSYGTRVRAFEITTLTTSSYAERELESSPILGPGQQPWNQSGMHHIDAHFTNNGWLACVDGWRFEPGDEEERKP